MVFKCRHNILREDAKNIIVTYLMGYTVGI